jgi:hypothetical protein
MGQQLMSYFQSVMPTEKKVDSEGQLRAAQAAASQYTSKQEAVARSNGFRSADEMYSFLKQRQAPPIKGSAPQRLSIADAVAWHPAKTIGMASDALARANGGD